MRKIRIAGLVATAGLALGLTACGGGASETQTKPVSNKPPAEASGPGTYLATTASGLQITAEVTVPSSDPRVAEAEKWREEYERRDPQTPEFEYIVAEYDNTKGTKKFWLETGLTVVTKGGETVEVPHLASGVPEGVIEKYGIIANTGSNENLDGSDEGYNREVDWSNSLSDQLGVLPGAKETVVLATGEEIPSVLRVYATTDGLGMTQVPMFKKPH